MKIPARRKLRSSRTLARVAGFTAIRRTNMVATVLKSLQDNIVAGRFGVDGFLPSEGELAQSFGVSRTVIREAMRGLAAYGLVEVSQGRPPRVRPADAQAAITSLKTLFKRGGGTLLHLVEVRRPLESEMAALAAERAGPEHLVRLEATLEELRQASTIEDQVEADVRFHRMLAEAAGNPVFGLFLDTVSGLLRESRMRTISHSGVEIALRHHRKILKAVKRHQVTGAREAMREHLRMAEHDLREERVHPSKKPGGTLKSTP
jgi:GntR family transcriptional repressor for pyruvate dehydrogenase complex